MFIQEHGVQQNGESREQAKTIELMKRLKKHWLGFRSK